MVEEYGKKGFVVVGVTSEPVTPTEKFIETTKSTMIVAYTKGQKATQDFGVSGYPSSVLVGPKGTVVWSGHPSRLTKKIVEQNLSGVSLVAPSPFELDIELPKAHKSIVTKLSKGDLGYGLVAIDKALGRSSLKDEDRDALTAARELVLGRLKDVVASIDESREAGRYADAEVSLEQIVKHFKNHESGKIAREELTALKRDADLRDELEAGRRIIKAQGFLADGQTKRSVSALKSVAKGRLEGTREAERARKLLDEINAAQNK